MKPGAVLSTPGANKMKKRNQEKHITKTKPAPARASARSLALDTLSGISGGRYGSLAVDAVLRRCALDGADRSLYAALVFGVLERQTTLDFLIGQLSDRPTDGLEEPVRLALRLGLYQLLYLDRVPDYAAIDETVSLVPRRAAGFVNAILRSYLRMEQRLGCGCRENGLRTPEEWQSRFPALAGDRRLAVSVAYGMPLSMCDALTDAMGSARAESVMAAFGRRPPLTLRVNPRRTSLSALEAALTEAGMSVCPGHYGGNALLVTDTGSGGGPTALPGFEEGAFFVQDEASQLCVRALDARPGQTVVDVCACPGSKSFGAALDMEDRGRVLSFDLHESKLSLVRSGAERLGLHVIEAARRDARQPDPALLGQADRVLCDVPCSGLGVMAKKPEIRYKDMAESARLPDIQRDILAASSGYVKPGGVLVYSTCTLLPAENERTVETFLAANPSFEPLDFSFSSHDPDYPDLTSVRGAVTLTPDVHGTDGFFIARMRRKESDCFP